MARPGEIRDGLLKGRIRDNGQSPSAWHMKFDDALAVATLDDLLYAANLMIGHPHVRRSYRERRITMIATKLDSLRHEMLKENAPQPAHPTAAIPVCASCQLPVDDDPHVIKEWSSIGVSEYWHTNCFVREHIVLAQRASGAGGGGDGTTRS